MRDYAELVKALNEISDKTSCYYCHGESLDCKTAGCYISDAADAIEELLVKAGLWHRRYQLEHEKVEKLRSALPHWISVEERLPEENYAVLGYCQKNQCVFTVFRQGEHWMHFAEHTTPVFYPVTHWMQLPESPKEVE